jgi:peroxiredoxin
MIRSGTTPALGAVFFCAFFLLSCNNSNGKNRSPVVGEPMPNFNLPDLHGEIFRLSEHRGEVLLINFWASWCAPCVEEMPSLERLHRALEAKGLRVVAVSVDDDIATIRRFREEHDLSFLILHDEGASVSHTFETFKYPETYIIDREGRLLSKVVGARDWITPRIMVDLVGLLKEGNDNAGE